MPIVKDSFSTQFIGQNTIMRDDANFINAPNFGGILHHSAHQGESAGAQWVNQTICPYMCLVNPVSRIVH